MYVKVEVTLDIEWMALWWWQLRLQSIIKSESLEEKDKDERKGRLMSTREWKTIWERERQPVSLSNGQPILPCSESPRITSIIISLSHATINKSAMVFVPIHPAVSFPIPFRFTYPVLGTAAQLRDKDSWNSRGKIQRGIVSIKDILYRPVYCAKHVT